MAEKFYAVKVGKTPGIYSTWDACRPMVEGFPGAVYKSFRTRTEAEAYLAIDPSAKSESLCSKEDTLSVREKENYAYVDGSFNESAGIYGYGGFLMRGEEKYILQGSGDDPEMASMRNVAGEILGSMAAVRKAIELGIDELTVYYDYLGIEMWATGAWKRNKKGTIAYYEYMQSARQRIALHFVKVKGHSGVDGNEEADRLAKTAVGI